MTPRAHISLYELLSTVRCRIDETFPLPVWVAAEVSELKEGQAGHCYMELVDKGEKDRLPRAKCNAVVWRSQWGAVSAHFFSATGQRLAAGVRIMCRATAVMHELYGFSLHISDIDPSYTLGEMERQRRETIRLLEEEGVFDMNRSLPLPRPMQRIAVVSSPNAAGYQDFMNELEASPYNFACELFDAFMQGAGTENSVVEALERVAARCEEFDAVAIIRGGGAQSDLSAFDSYRLCNHVAQFPLPVLTGIGHDKDRSVADLVAAISLKTPTAVARRLIDGMDELWDWLCLAGERVASAAQGFLSTSGERLQQQALMLSRHSSALTRSLEVRLERYSGEVLRLSGAVVSARRSQLDRFGERLISSALALLASARSQLELAEASVAARDPRRILEMGFAQIRTDSGTVYGSSALSVGSTVEILFGHDAARATIDKIY
ncbi:MAG: exodeoxyribonuclease VII large subunit [Rikenellaceae bacterium]|jgi:exodeoxyribonuclease VII large subunit|nr:exodeoxyribonuclease VII large subunit [Rikenellaceae bacterium]